MSTLSGFKRSQADADWVDSVMAAALLDAKVNDTTMKDECEINAARYRKLKEEIERADMEAEKLRPFWMKYKELPPPLTFEEAKIRIEKLEEALDDCRE
jgi:hypothetical protein